MGSIIQVKNTDKETTQAQKKCFRKKYDHITPGETSQSHVQVTETIIVDKVRKEVDSVVAAAVENCVHGATLTLMDGLVFPRAENLIKTWAKQRSGRSWWDKFLM